MLRIKSALICLSFSLFFIIGSNSCISKRNLTYFQSLDTSRTNNIKNDQPVYKLQTRDVISIRIKTLDTKTSEYFNVFPNNQFQQINPAALYVNGYSIDNDGNITLPEIGDIQVVDLTIKEAQTKIQAKLTDFVANASILVKLVSFKITLLGEVANPGYYFVYNDKANILEGLGLAGDLTDNGQRDNITLIRQIPGGSKTVLLNLKDPALLASPYFYLMPNDVIYVQPLKAKLDRGNLNTLSVLSILFGAISASVLLLNYLKK